MKTVVATQQPQRTTPVSQCGCGALYILRTESLAYYKLHTTGAGDNTAWMWCSMSNSYNILRHISHHAFDRALNSGLNDGTVMQFKDFAEFREWFKT